MGLCCSIHQIGIYYTYSRKIWFSLPSIFPRVRRPHAMQLTTHSDYALRLLIYLTSHQTRKVSTREVADAYGISLNHLTKVAKSLTKAGWLLAARGGGGVHWSTSLVSVPLIISPLPSVSSERTKCPGTPSDRPET